MIRPTVLYFCIVVYVLIASDAAQVERLRGVPDSKRPLYTAQNGIFQCLSDKKTIPQSAINDDYCDCEDGSDEPGTSACPQGKFYCRNEGFRPKYIPSSRVDDGVCDCCDGSDEALGRVKCAPDCARLAAEARREVEQRARAAQQGLLVREANIANAESGRKSLKEKFEQAKEEHKTLQAGLEELKAVQGKLSDIKKRQKEERKKQAASSKDSGPKSVLRKYQEQIERLAGERDRLYRMIAELKPYITKEVEALKLLDEYDRFESKTKFQLPSESEISADDSSSPAQKPKKHTKPINSELKINPTDSEEDAERTEDETEAVPDEEPEHNGPPSSADDAEPAPAQPAPDTHKPGSETGWGFLRSSLDKVKDLLVGSENPNPAATVHHATDAPKEKLKEIDEEIKKLEERIRKLDETIRETEKQLGYDYGRQSEFFYLLGQTLRFDTPDYTYELTPYHQVVQVSKKGGQRTNLGHWSNWPSGQDQDSKDYSSMLFTAGERCWNGPERSTKILLECSTEDRIVSVGEPARCEYLMHLETTAACSPDLVKMTSMNALLSESPE